MNMLKLEETHKIPTALNEMAQNQLHDLLHSVGGMNFVMLCTTDGFEVVLKTKKNMQNTGKIAAVSSSILAMVSAFISEISLIGCKSMSLDADNGKVMLSAVEHPTYPMVLVASASADVLIGQMGFYMKKTVDHLVDFQE